LDDYDSDLDNSVIVLTHNPGSPYETSY
jgi:hypothetical protein